MQHPESFHNQRLNQRVPVNLTVKISFGSQVTLTGRVKDLSLKSAFIVIKGGVHMQLNDEIAFVIESPEGSTLQGVNGLARISRVSAGEGIAVYFVRMDEDSTSHLKKMVEGLG